MSLEERLQQAIFDRFQHGTQLLALTRSYNVPFHLLKRHNAIYWFSPPASQPEASSDIHLSLRRTGRPFVLSSEEEGVIASAAAHFAENQSPLTRQGIQLLAQSVCKMLPANRRQVIPFKDMLPSMKWMQVFLDRHDALKLRRVRGIEDRRVQAVTRENVCAHIARLEAAIDRFNVHDPGLHL